MQAADQAVRTDIESVISSRPGKRVMPKVSSGPARLAARLRRIAASIDASRNPDRRLVAAAIRKALEEVEVPYESAMHAYQEISKGVDKLGDLLDSNSYDDLAAATDVLRGEVKTLSDYGNFGAEHPDKVEGNPKHKK
jgi:hypothetical protein